MNDPPSTSSLGHLWAELRRRRVIRVAIVYAIAGWVIIEVASTMLPGLKLPAWTVTFVIALVVLGFPIAVLMGWMFDLGPGGVERAGAASSPAETVTAGAAAAQAATPSPAGPGPQPAPEPELVSVKSPEHDPDGRRTIAVLPFVNMSEDASNEYFSDGISEEILNLLTKLSQLKVASRTSSFAFKGSKSNIRAVADELGVGIVLEGSVRRAGDHVRITAQLIEAESDSHLWSETYDRAMKDVFAIQDDIAESIVKALQVTLTPRDRRAMQFVATANPEAYDYYLRGRNYMYSMARRDYEHAIRMFRQAIDIDPQYALAHAGIADAYSHIYRYSEASQANVESANRASERAVALDPDCAEAHASHGLALFISEKYSEAEQEFETAAALNANLFEAWYYYGLTCSTKGDFTKAAELYSKAMKVNPDDFQAPVFLAQAYCSLGKKQEEMQARLNALATIERHLKLNPHDARALYLGSTGLRLIGDDKRAMEWAERALGQDENEPVVIYNVACFYSESGDKERAIDLLEKAVNLGWGDRAWMETDSDLAPLHDQPRFRKLLERMP